VASGALGDTGLASLARLATDTGGRYSEQTNDYTLGFARAQRDAACVYTLGFYLEEDRGDRPQQVVIRVDRPGLRAIHASRHRPRSDGERQESLLRAAWVAPEMFQTGVVRAHLFPLRPSSKRAWDGLLAVRFPVPLGGGSSTEIRREFGAVLTKGPAVVHRFSRLVTLQPEETAETSEPTVTFLEPVTLTPGTYTLTAVLTEPGRGDPHASKTTLVVPEVPRKELFLVDPLLGRVAGGSLVIEGQRVGEDRIRSETTFEPLLIRDLDDPGELVALTQACWVGSKRGPRSKSLRGAAVHRQLRTLDGRPAGSIDPVPLALDEGTRIRCQNLLDTIPASGLKDGEYAFEATLASPRIDDPPAVTVRFAVGDAAAMSESDPPDRNP
jgi:hypothetical protein